MPRRSLLTLLALAALVTVAVLAPRTQVGRDWLLTRVQGAAEEAGWSLRWRDASGDPWRSLELRGLEVVGPGVDAFAGYARVTWFAPGLLTGELPLWIEVRNADVALDPGGFAGPSAGGGAPPIRPELRDVDLSGLRLRVGGAAYRLPDLSIDDLSVAGGADALTARGRLSTPDGGLTLDATVDPAGPSFRADVRDADLTLARFWWSDLEGGVAHGQVVYAPDAGLSAELEVEDGAFAVAGWRVADVAGPVTLRNDLVEAELSGATLGGPVAATGRVDLVNRAWSASARATPDLADAARWAGGPGWPQDLLPQGDALVTATATGWRDVTIDASARAAGTLDGRPVTLATDDARYASATGLRVVASGQALGARLDLDLAGAVPGTDGPSPVRVAATVAGASYGPARDVAGEIALVTGDGPPRASIAAAGTLVAGSSLDAAPLGAVQVDGELNDGALTLFLTGRPELGGRLEGAVTLEDGRWSGGGRLTDVGPLAGQPVAVRLTLDGPLDALALEAALEGDAPWRPAGWDVAPALDLRGTARAVLRPGRLEDLQAAFGPLSLAGDLPLAPGDDPGTLTGGLAPVRLVAAGVDAALAAPDLTLVPWTDEGLRIDGSVRATDLALPDAALGDVAGTLRVRLPLLATGGAAAPSVAVDADTFSASWTGDRLAWDVDGHPATVAGARATIDGEVRLSLDDPTRSLRGTLSVATPADAGPTPSAPSLALRASADDDGWRLDARLSEGAMLGGAPLPGPALATARLPLDGSAGPLTIDLGPLAYRGTLRAGGGDPLRPAAEGVLTGGLEQARLTADAGTARLTLDGALDLGSVAAWAGLDAAGTLRAEGVALTPEAAAGRLEAILDAPVAARLAWTDGELTGRVPSPVGEVALAGGWAPGRPWTIVASHPWGRLTWDAAGPVGAGTIPARAWRGAAVDPLPWTLEGAADGASVGPLPALSLRLGDGAGGFRDGRLTLDLDLPVAIGGAPARVTGPLAWSPEATTVAARLVAPDGATWARLEGTWPTLDLGLDVPAARLAAAADVGGELRGDVRLRGTLDPTDRSGAVTGSWTAGPSVAELEARLDDAGPVARLATPGLELGLDADGVRLTAADARLDAFAPAAGGVRLDGALSARWSDGPAAWRDAAWQGRLAVAVPDLATVELSATDGPLRASAQAARAGIQARVDGTLLPDLALDLELAHPPSGARLVATAEATGAWTLADATLAGVARLPRATGSLAGVSYAAGPIEATVRGSADGLVLDGDAIGRIALQDGGWSGAIATDLELDGATHRLSARLGGPALAPSVGARLDGPSLFVEADYDVARDQGVARARATPALWPDGWSAARPGDATLDASLGRDGAWSATLTAAAAPGGRPLELRADAAGRGRAGDAAWSAVAPDGTVLLRGDAGSGGDGLRVRSDVAGWDLPALARWGAGDAAVPPLAAAGTGRIVYARAPDGTSRLEATTQIAGRLGEAPLRLVTRVDEAAATARLDLGDDTVALGRSASGEGWILDAAGADYALRGSLDAALRVGRLSGAVADLPLDLRIARTDAGLLAVGRWDVTELNVGVLQRDDGWRADLEARRPVADAGAWAGAVDASARLSDGRVELDRLDATVTGPVQGQARLAGPLWPTAALEGAWTGPPGDAGAPATLDVRGDAGAWTARVAAAGLSLDAAGAGLRPARLRLDGASDAFAPLALTVDPSLGLTWSEREGWSGAVGARLAPADGLRADLRAAGGDDGALVLTGEAEARVDGVAPARARLTLDARADGAPWAAPLIGRALLEAGIDGRDGAAAAVLAGDLELSGRLIGPRAAGAIRLRGVAPADGALEADAGGIVLELAGETLDLRATLDGAGWRAGVDARDLPLEAWLPDLASPTLEVQAEVAGGGSDGLRATARRLVLRADGARLSGDALWQDGLLATLELDADLAQALGAGASGRLVGPLSVRADDLASLGSIELAAALRAQEVRLAGVAVDGEASLDGTLPFPDLRADLRLAGPLEGTVRATWLPERRRIDLTTDLRDARGDDPVWTAELRLAAADGTVEADGAVTTPDGAWTARAGEGRIRLEGDGRWSGSELVLAPFEGERGRIEATLPLGALADALAGRLVASVAAEQDGVRGRLEDLALLGQALPALDLRAEGATLLAAAADRSATASFDPLQGAWSVGGAGLPVGTLGTLDVDAQGRGALGRIDATLTGAGGDALRLHAARDADASVLELDGRWAGGEVELEAERLEAGGVQPWTGRGALRGVATPAGPVRATATLGGDGTVPTARVELAIDGPVPTSGILALDADATASADLTATLPGDAPLRVAGELWPRLELRLTGSDGTARLQADAWSGAAPWRLSGATRVELPGLEASIAGEAVRGEERPVVRVRADALAGASLRAELPRAAPADAVARLAREGLAFEGEGALGGRVTLTPAGTVASDGLAWASPLGRLTVAGRASPDRIELTGALAPQPDPSTAWAATWASLADGAAQAYTVSGSAGAVRAQLVEGPLQGRVDWDGADGSLRVEATGDALDATLRLARGAGVQGELRIDGLRLPSPGDLDAVATGAAVFGGDRVRLDAALVGPGRVGLEADWPLAELLPSAYRPPVRPAPGRASLRLASLDVASLPGVGERLPFLSGSLSGVAELRDRRLIVQLAAPELATAGRALPLRVEGAGTLARDGEVSFGGTLAGSRLQGSLTLAALELLAVLERFPGQAPIEALLGPVDADVEATGALRLRLPWQDPLDGEVRLATELVRLERAGVVTTGVLSADATRTGLSLEADFRGEGRWTASAIVTPERLDVRVEADDADATPLLGLVPALARLQTSAAGTLTATARGTPADPRIAIDSPGLEVGLAGTRYRVERASATLDGADARVSGVVTGVEPVGGRLDVDGTARLDLAGRRLEDAAVRLQGDLEAPFVGRLEGLDGRIEADAQGRPALALDARLGAPLRIEGTLAPLDLSARGDGVTLRIPTLLLDRARADVDLTLRYEDALHLAGSVTASEGRFALGIRPPRPDDAGSGGGAASALVFDDLTVVGRQLSFSEGFGSADFDADLRLGGTAAAPRLDGVATARRGTFRFSGRDFRLLEAVARFEPSRGAFPQLEVVAAATFDQRAVLQGVAPGVAFVQPGGSTFDVRLAFDAEVVPTPDGPRPFDLSIDPVLTSNAEISVPGAADGATLARPLSEAELLQLVALGRLDLAPGAAAGDVAGGVARSALDNAVDLLVLAELQSAVAQALGVDLVEIRTSALSDVLAGGDDPFGVSLRLGGYLSEGLFASFEIGRVAGEDGDATLSNTLALTYDLGPVSLDLATRVGIPDAAELAPTTELSGTLRYQLTPLLAIEGGATLSTPAAEARFGVTLRW
jgi:hypothetical protein